MVATSKVDSCAEWRGEDGSGWSCAPAAGRDAERELDRTSARPSGAPSRPRDPLDGAAALRTAPPCAEFLDAAERAEVPGRFSDSGADSWRRAVEVFMFDLFGGVDRSFTSTRAVFRG